MYQYIDSAGKARIIVHKFPSSKDQNDFITITCEPMSPINVPSFDERNPRKFLTPVDYNRAIKFLLGMGIKPEMLSYRTKSDIVMVDTKITTTVDQPPEQQSKIGGLLTGPASKVSTLQQLLIEPTSEESLFPLIQSPVKGIESEETKQEKRETVVTVIKRGEALEEMAFGIWFTISGIQFYIATTAGKPLTQYYSINNTPDFEIEPEIVMFKLHDEYERVANIMVQLLRNIYIYSRADDPEFFMDAFTVIDSTVKYQVVGARRRIPSYRNEKDLFAYAEIYPSFYTQPTTEEKAKFIPKLKLDSIKTKERLTQHLWMVQRLKENIIGASGSKLKILERSADNPRRKIQYRILADNRWYPNETEWFTGLNNLAIEKIVRMKEFFERPDFIDEFFIYPSDFTVRGPDQNVFMSEDELRQYLDLSVMEQSSIIVSIPIDPKIFLLKTPSYLAVKDGSLYILQTVVGGNLRRVLTILNGWERERINLGYFAEEWTGSYSDVYMLNILDLPKLDISQHYVILEYEPKMYAALLKLSGTVAF